LQSVIQGGEPLASYEYDGNNNRTVMLDGRGNRTSYAYDQLNRATQVNHAGNLQTKTFDYDAVENVVKYNDGAGGDITQSYDELNHLKTRTDRAGDTTQFKYDGATTAMTELTG
jgi:YD repeat-containing protein